MRLVALALLAMLPAHAALSQVTEARVTGGSVSGIAEGSIDPWLSDRGF